jgi:hypothetical protein
MKNGVHAASSVPFHRNASSRGNIPVLVLVVSAITQPVKTKLRPACTSLAQNRTVARLLLSIIPA